MNKNTKKKIEKAAERYGKREAKKITYLKLDYVLERAFLDGIKWYRKNLDKLNEEEALDLYFKICKKD